MTIQSKSNASVEMEEYFQNATLHGVSKVYSAKRKHTKLFWLTVLLLVIGSFCYLLQYRLQQYFDYGMKVTMTHEENTGSMQFPAVTICNVNRVSTLRLENMLYELTGKVFNQEYCREKKDAIHIFSEEEMSNLSNIDNLFVPGTSLFNGITIEYNQTYFQREATIAYGTCFTFNYQGYESQSKPGSKHGLKMVMDIEVDDYFVCDFLKNHNPAGVYISIHHPNSPPSKRRIVASPGKLTRIGLTKTYTKRLEHPYKDNCRPENDISQDEYPIITYRSYSVEECQSTCLIFKMNETCGVIDFESSISIAKRYVDHFTVVDEYNTCIRDFLCQYYSGLVKCKCRPVCDEYNYNHIINTAEWPPKVVADGWAKYLSDKKNKSIDKEYVKENIVAVEIFYNEFRTIKTVHTPEYSIDTLAADMGGLSGLFIGASVFSLVELVVFLLAAILKKFSIRKNNKKINVNNTKFDKQDSVTKVNC